MLHILRADITKGGSAPKASLHRAKSTTSQSAILRRAPLMKWFASGKAPLSGNDINLFAGFLFCQFKCNKTLKNPLK
jgi:hypothetical protein